MPEPVSRTTIGVDASVAAVTRRLERWAQGWLGPTTTTASSTPISRWRSPLGGSGPSTKPEVRCLRRHELDDPLAVGREEMLLAGQ